MDGEEARRGVEEFFLSQCFCLFFTKDTRMFWSSASVVTRLQRAKFKERGREGEERETRQTDRHQVLP